MDANIFARPPKEFSEVPFWSWNDDLDFAELRRQIQLMDGAGWGSFFMHSRTGLKTPYLGRRWMECVRVCVEEAAQRGMGAWLYDEDKWPSGFAGGLAAVDPRHRAQALICLVDNKPARLADGLAAFIAERDHQGRLSKIQPLGGLTSFDGDRHSLVQFYVYRSPLGQAWFNGYTYVNTLEPAAVRAFIDSTYAVYAREFGEHFQQAIPGIFTDEPAYLSMNIPNIGVEAPGEIQPVPWFDDLPDLFQRRWGYDLLPHLPALFFDSPNYPAVRYHFWRLVTERFVESYSKQIYDWCSDHQLRLTGHYLLEDNLWVQTRWIGAAMPHYEYEHIPGIDKLSRNLYTVLTVKQLDSAVCQLGKPRALCESYGCAGQDFSLAGRKWIGDWLYVLGINLNNPHLALYSMRGERKRDYPANLFYQQPWWPENHLVADYFARLSYALSQGQRVVDLLVLHPMGSAWSRYRPDSRETVDELNAGLSALEQVLLNHQRDFHYGDELLMEKHARIDPNGPCFVIGAMRYRAVIVPPSFTWSAFTLRLLSDFATAGGLVLAVPPLPCEIEGCPAEQPLPSSTRIVALADLIDVLDQELPAQVSISDAPHVWVHQRRVGQADLYFLANTSLEQSYTTRISLRGSGRLEAWDPATGCVAPLLAAPLLAAPLPASQADDTLLELHFPPSGSHLLCLHHDQPRASAGGMSKEAAQPARPVALDDQWRLRLEEPNSITLDTATVQLGDRPWSDPLPILEAHARVRAAGPGVAFGLRYSVMIEETPPDPVWLVVETPEAYQITVNERPVETAGQEYWKDISFHKLSINGMLQVGENTITLRGQFAPETELESVYLLGWFGVRLGRGQRVAASGGQVFFRYPPQFAITALPGVIQTGDLVCQGLPFFAGRVRLSQEIVLAEAIDQPLLQIDGLNAAVARVVLDGVETGLAAWPPYQIALGEHLDAGAHTLEIELTGTLRNLLGPHHQRRGDGEGVSPQSFRSGPDWTDDYVFVPFGFQGAAIIA